MKEIKITNNSKIKIEKPTFIKVGFFKLSKLFGKRIKWN